MVELRAATEDDRALQEARKLSAESRGLYNAGKYDDAKPLLESALAIREKALGMEHPDTANSLNSLANIYYIKGDFVRAEPLYHSALAIREKALGADHPEVAQTLNGLALLYHWKVSYAQAEPLYRRALDIREKALAPDHPEVARSLNNLALFLQDKGEYEKVEPLYQRALVIRETSLGSEHPEVAETLNNLGFFHFSKGDYAKAELLYQQALAIREKAFAPSHPDIARSLYRLGELYQEKGDFAKVEQLFQRALAIRRESFGPDHPLFANALYGLALFYQERGDHAQAVPLHEQALAIREKMLGEDQLYVAESLRSLASIDRIKGEYARAESRFQRALDIRRALLGPGHPDVAESLTLLALLYRDQGRYAEAERMYRQALAIREKSLGTEHPNVAQSLNHLAQLHAAKGEVAQAVMLRARASAIIERSLALNLATGSERQKLAYLATLSAQADYNLSLHVQAAPNDTTARDLATTTILQRKGRALDAMSDTLAALRQRFNAQDQALLDQLNNTTARLARLVLGGPQRTAPAEHQKQIRALEEQKEDLDAEISRRSAEFRAQAQPITLAAVQAAIPADVALIEFAAYRPFNTKAAKDDDAFGAPHYVVYIVRQRGEIQWKALGEAKAIDDAIAALRQALRDPKRPEVKSLARIVEEKAFRPVRALLGEATRLLISPDGALNLIPFEALLDEKDRYLIERYSFTYLTSGRDLLRLQVAREGRSVPLVVADPAFGELEKTQLANADAPQSKATERGRKRQSATIGTDLSNVYFAPLSGTGLEAQAIKSLFPEATLLTQRHATEAALKQAAAPRILHIATHGFFLEEGARGLNRPSSEADLRALNASVKIENPLLRSGLALTGANLRKGGDDDGILTTLEASGLNLWGTKLVVLSACDTGVGVVTTGEGVYGLRRALVLAGSETQVMSLWPVNDYVTPQLMKAYYAGLKQGRGRGEALRLVKLEMLRRQGMEHPFYWASFIQSGEWANLDGKR
jgi:CHAT domain-containing protein